MAQQTSYDIIIIGQGAAAFSAALYAARYQVKTIVVGETFGGETATGGLIENYPGHVEILGFDLMLNMKEQATKYDVPIIDAKVERIEQGEHCFYAHAASETYQGASVIMAMGRERRKLGLPHEDEWVGHGVSYCSVCDAPLYRNRSAIVVGGGDAAIKGAALVSQYADKVYVVYRGKEFTRPEAINLQTLRERANVEPIFNANVVELRGSDGLTSVVLDREFNGSRELPTDGLLIEIGADPNIDLAKQLGVNLNPGDEIIVDKAMRTNIDGVFAAGDITDASGELKQAITAAAQGAIAATSAHQHVLEHPNACQCHAMGYSLA